jgi:hypothetical protein
VAGALGGRIFDSSGLCFLPFGQPPQISAAVKLNLFLLFTV